jgi:predicted nucleic acid-binding protein
MARKAECYADTSALIAFLDRSDSYHSLFRRLFSDPPSLVTSALVIAEGHAWFLRRYDSRRALQFLSFIEDLTPLVVIAFGGKEVDQATAVVKRFHDQDLTLADAHGLVIINERQHTTCWSTDRHLALGGAALVI